MKAPERTLPLVALLAILAVQTLVCAAKTVESELINGGFDDDSSTSMTPWLIQGERYGRARIVNTPVASGPHSLELEAIGKGSTGNESAMVYQMLDPGRFRGRTLELRAAVRTAGLGVNLVLHTDKGMSNDFYKELQSGSFVSRSTSLDVPMDAGRLSVGIQIFGAAGGKAWIDDVALVLEPAPPSNESTSRDPGGAGSDSENVTNVSKFGTARMRIDARQPLRDIDPRLFCMHIEWVEAGLGLVDENTNRLRTPVLDLIQPLRIGAFRFPGGIHADFYEWRQGIGPHSSRGMGRNAFKKNREAHVFGTEEFLSLLDRTGADACITTNYGTGTAEDAGAWAKYFAGTEHRPSVWEVGNEIYLSDAESNRANSEEIFKTGEQYARDFPDYRRAIQAALPDAKVGMIGHLDNGAFALSPAGNRNWTQHMLRAFDGRADFMAVHNAYAPVVIDDSVRFDEPKQRRDAYRALYASVHQTAENFDLMSRTIERLSPQNAGIPFAVTEFGPLFGISKKLDIHSDYVDQTRTLASAIYTASLLDVFIADSRVFMSCYTNPIHRWYGSLITDTESGLVTTPTYYVYQLYRSRFESRLLHSELDGPRFDSPEVGIVAARKGSPTVMGHASVSPDGRRLTAMVINRAVEDSVPFFLEVDGFDSNSANCRILGGDTGNSRNGPALGGSTRRSSPTLEPRDVPCSFEAGNLRMDLPAHSILSILVVR